jgi:hypothetical protein
MEVGERRVGRVAVERPQPFDRPPVDRERDRAARGRDRDVRQLGGLVRALVGAEVLDRVRRQQALEPRLVGALGQPRPRGRAEATSVRAKPGIELQAAALARREHRQDRVRRRGGEQLDAPGRGRRSKQLEQVAVECLEPLERDAIAVCLGPTGVAQRRLEIGEIRLAGADPELAAELDQPLGDPGRLELVGEHRGDGHRHPVGAPAHRYV